MSSPMSAATSSNRRCSSSLSLNVIIRSRAAIRRTYSQRVSYSQTQKAKAEKFFVFSALKPFALALTSSSRRPLFCCHAILHVRQPNNTKVRPRRLPRAPSHESNEPQRKARSVSAGTG
jgi:hypothetical protein